MTRRSPTGRLVIDELASIPPSAIMRLKPIRSNMSFRQAQAAHEGFVNADFAEIEMRAYMHTYGALKAWHDIMPRYDPVMSFTSSHAVAEAYACNDEELAMFGRIVAAETAVSAGIVFA